MYKSLLCFILVTGLLDWGYAVEADVNKLQTFQNKVLRKTKFLSVTPICHINGKNCN
jgi:hypothetical protein